MATFQENVDYIVNDKSTMDRFHVELTFTFNVTPYLQANTFRITIYDVMTHRDLTITADDLIYGNSYGLVPIPIDEREVNPTTKAKQLDDSLIENDGLVIFFSGNVLTIVMIPRCSNDTKTIGFYSSSIYIQFSQDDDIKNSITFYAALYPKILRDNNVIQYDDGIDDPIFGADKNIRPAYDFNKNISKSIDRFNYDTKEIFYANTTYSAHNKEGEVPVYISKISAYGIDEYDRQMLSFEYDWENAKSYLIDEVDGTVHDNIPYNVVVPNSYEIEPVSGYTASIDNYLITQYIYRETPGFYKNKLVFELQNLPTSTALDKLVVTIEDLTPAHYTIDSPSGTAVVKIYNPNVDYRDINLLEYGIIDTSENLYVDIDREHIDYSNYESYGEILIPLKDIHFVSGIKKADGQFGFEAYINAEIAGLTREQVKAATYGCDYIMTDFYTVRPELTKLQIELTWDPEYENNMIMPDESETVHVTITNNNLDYIDLQNYPIEYTCTWNGEEVPLSSITNLDTSNYDEYHYITFDVIDLRSDSFDPPSLKYLFEVTAYIFGSDPDVSPEITEQWMEDKTKNSAEVEFTLYVDVLEHLVFLENTLVYNPTLDVDEQGNLIKVIKKNETQGFTIDLYNPNINHRIINAITMTLYSPDKRYFNQVTDGVHLEFTYDANYESKSDISGAGIIHVTVTNMHIDHIDIQKLIGLYAYIDIDGHEPEDTDAIYEDGQFWTMDDPVIPHDWDYMKNYVIYTDSVLETENSYIGVRDIRCAGANFSFTNVESDVYCIGPLTINNHNMNPNLDYYCGNYPGITATGSSYGLNFYNYGNIKYNITVPAGTKKPMLYYYYNPEDPEGNNRFENTNNSVIGNDPYAGYKDDGGMIITDRMVKEIKQLPIYPGTRTINLFQDVSYNFATHLSEFECDAEKGIYKANAFRASNHCTITLYPGEFHFNTFDADTYFTIVVPVMNDDEYVKIMVQGNINISNNLTIINNNDRMDSLLLYSNSGNISFAAAGDTSNPDRQIGLAVAPRGTISLSNKFIWKGGTWARKVIVQARSEYHLLPEAEPNP